LFLFSVWTEKKLLYSKLRIIPVNERATTVEKPSVDKKDASTVTEDLGVDTKFSICLSISTHINYIFLADLKFVVYLDTGEISSSETLTSTVDILEDAGTSVLRSNIVSDFPSSEQVSSSIPDDQLRMIDNINSLMSEVISFYCHKCGILLRPDQPEFLY
jgi:hypothetical protein